MALYMVALHKVGKEITGVRLVEFDYDSKNINSVTDIPYKNVIDTLIQGRATIENAVVNDGKLVGVNGQISRYGVIQNGIVIGQCPLVILMECDRKVYLVSNPLGQLKYMTENEVIKYAMSEGIANGKIVTTETGSYISSIEGEYPKDKLIKQKGSGKMLKAKMKIAGVKEYSLNEYNLAYWNPDVPIKSEEITLGSGCLGIAPGGFARSPYKKIVLPPTVETIGPRAFEDMKGLEELVIPEGVELIPTRMCRNCKELKKISIPNSIKNIDDYAFMGCNKLKDVETGPSGRAIHVRKNVFPRGTNIRVRK